MSAGRSREASLDSASAVALAPDLPWLATLFVATLWTMLRQMGSSPTVWIDTLFENQFVDDCVFRNQCTLVGPGATVGIFHSAGYLHWRALMEGIGFTPDGTYLWLLSMNALGVVLAALAARRLAGPAAAAIAAVVMAAALGVPTQLNVISDVAPVPFLGAVFLALAITAQMRPGLGLTAVLGMVAGVMANVYATGVLCGLSAAWIALLNRERRWTHAVVAVGCFVVTTIALAPGTWVIDASILWSRGVVGNANPSGSRPALALGFAPVAALACLAWLLAAAARGPLRRRLDVPAAIFLPLVVPLVVGSWVGRLDAQDKYFSHVIGAVAVGVAVPVVVAVQQLWRGASRLIPPLADLAPGAAALAYVAPYAAAGLIVLLPATKGSTAPPPPSVADLKFRDLVAAERVLAGARHWSWADASRNLKATDEIARLAALSWIRGWPEAGAAVKLERAYFLKVAAALVPKPLPANVVVARSTDSSATLLVFTRSWIDWSAFRVCVTRPPATDSTCTPSGLPATPGNTWNAPLAGMPIVDASNLAHQTLQLHLSLQPGEQSPEEWIFMPHLPLVCSGRIVSIDGGTRGIEDSGRWAKLSARDTPAELVVEWELGGPDCTNQYRGYPPFFIEGDPASVNLLTRLLKEQLQWP